MADFFVTCDCCHIPVLKVQVRDGRCIRCIHAETLVLRARLEQAEKRLASLLRDESLPVGWPEKEVARG